MENELRYRVRCSQCGVVEGKRYVRSGGKRYWFNEREAIPAHLRVSVVRVVQLRLVPGQAPICFDCLEEQ